MLVVFLMTTLDYGHAVIDSGPIHCMKILGHLLCWYWTELDSVCPAHDSWHILIFALYNVHTVLDNGHIHCLYDRIYTWQWTYPFYIILKSGHIKNFYTAGYLTVNLSIVCFHCLYTWQWTYPLFVLLYSWQWSYPLS